MSAAPEIVHRSHLASEVVLRRDKMALVRYPAPHRRFRTSVLFVPALISRPAILDLAPGRSLVEAIVGAGFETYLVDWGIPDRSSAHVSLATLVDEYLERAVARVRALQRGPVALVGYCMGGTMAATYAARVKLRKPDLLVTIAAPVDFRYGGKLARWCAPDVLDLERVLATFGNVPAHLIEGIFATLRPTARVRAMIDARTDAPSVALRRWSQTWTDFPAAAARDWIGAFYRENRLASGTLVLDGKPVDLAAITAPLLAIAAADDEIAPFDAVSPLADLVGSRDTTSYAVPGGHIALVAGSAASRTTWPRIESWLIAHSEPAR